MNNIIKQFEEYLVDNDKAKSTIKAYVNTMESFSNWLATEQDMNLDTDILDINLSKLLAYRNSLTSKDLAPNTINRKINVIKTFFVAMVDLDIIEKNPALKLKKVKAPNVQKEIPTLDKFVEIKETIVNKKIEGRAGDLRTSRDGAIVNFLLGLGLRSSELRNLKLTDIDENGKINIIGKGNKYRVLYLNKELKEIYNSYLRVREEYINDKKIDTDLVFISYRGNKLGADTINNILKEASREIGESDKMSAHMCRHAFVTEKIKQGLDIKLVSVLAGHARTQTTLDVYTHAFEDEIKKVMTKEG